MWTSYTLWLGPLICLHGVDAVGQLPSSILRRYKQLHSETYGPITDTEHTATSFRRGRNASDTLSAKEKHFWPHARGRVQYYSKSRYPGPVDMKVALRWSWHHPEGRYHTTVTGGPLIDSRKNIYLAAEDGVRKFSPDGEVQWHYKPSDVIVGCPSLSGDALFGMDFRGHLFAIHLDSGTELWSKKLSDTIGTDNAFVEAHNGIVVAAVDASGPSGGNKRILGVDTETGTLIWQFTTLRPTFNVMPIFPDDETTVLMDYAGGLYRLGSFNGSMVWFSPARKRGQSFTNGGVITGKDGSLYACTNPITGTGKEGQEGLLRKVELSTGKALWEAELPYPCNSWPAVSDDDSSVVVPIGSLPGRPATMVYINETAKLRTKLHQQHLKAGTAARSIYGLPDLRGALMSFHTKTGMLQWKHEVKPWGAVSAAGDEEGVLERTALKIRPMCIPAHWTAPTFGPDGTVFVGRLDGNLYSYKPEKGEQKFHTGSAALHPGVSFAPGLMAYADCDSLYVFKNSEPKI